MLDRGRHLCWGFPDIIILSVSLFFFSFLARLTFLGPPYCVSRTPGLRHPPHSQLGPSPKPFAGPDKKAGPQALGPCYPDPDESPGPGFGGRRPGSGSSARPRGFGGLSGAVAVYRGSIPGKEYGRMGQKSEGGLCGFDIQPKGSPWQGCARGISNKYHEAWVPLPGVCK